MFGLGKALKGLVSTGKKINDKDFMEGVVAASVIVAFADGSCSDTEKDKVRSIVSAHPDLKHFNPNDVIQKFDEYSALFDLDAGMAKSRILRELTEIPDAEKRETVYLIARAVANADGSIGAEETKALTEIAKLMGVKAN